MVTWPLTMQYQINLNHFLLVLLLLESPMSRGLCPFLVPKSLINNLFLSDNKIAFQLYGSVSVLQDFRLHVFVRDSPLLGVCPGLLPKRMCAYILALYVTYCSRNKMISWFELRLVKYLSQNSDQTK